MTQVADLPVDATAAGPGEIHAVGDAGAGAGMAPGTGDADSDEMRVVDAADPAGSRRWDELWEARELAWVLTVRSVRLRYRHTLLGVLWAVLQPLAAVAVLSLVLGRLVGVPSGDRPYPLFALAGFVPWAFVSRAVSQAAFALVEHRALLVKVWFPRLVLLAVPVLAGGVDFLLSLAAVIAVVWAWGFPPSPALLALPLMLALAALLVFAVAFPLAVWCARWPDVRLLLPWLLQGWFLISPIAYPAALVPGEWRPLYDLNPLAALVEGFRWCLLGSAEPTTAAAWVSAAGVAALLVAGFRRFRREESTLADLL